MLTLSLAVTSLIANATAGSGAARGGGGMTGPDLAEVDRRFKAQEAAVNGRLDSLRQEFRGGGIKIGGVHFTGREAAMDWARLHLPPGSYSCIG